MARTVLYLLVPLLYTFFWAAYLLSHYNFYVESDPVMLISDYQRLYAGQRTQLLSAELLFPLFMLLFFLALFFLRLRNALIRIPLLIAQFLSLEFFVYRQFIFPDSYRAYQSASQAGVPVEYLETASYYAYLLPLAAAFAILLLIRERKPAVRRAPRRPFA